MIQQYEWCWDEALNLTPFKLGRPVQEVLHFMTLVKQEANVSEYEGAGGYPWHVDARQGLISAVFFRTDFLELLAVDLWDRQAAALIAEVDQHLPRYPAAGGGDRLQIVFRDGFVTIAGFFRP